MTKPGISIFSLLLVLCITLHAQKPELIPYRKGKLWGYSDTNRKIVIEPQYMETFFFQDGLGKVRQEGLFGLIDKNGKPITPIQYDWIGDAVNGKVLARKPDVEHLMIVDAFGKEKIFEEYPRIGLLKSGLVSMRKDRKSGIMDMKGKVIVAPQYDRLEEWPNGYIKVQNKVRYRAETKIVKQDPRFTGQPTMEVDHEKQVMYMLVTKDQEKAMKSMGWNPEKAAPKMEFEGLYSPEGKLVLPVKYSDIRPQPNGLIYLVGEVKMAIATSEGKLLSEFKYDHIMDFQDGFAAFQVNGKHGYLNTKGEEVFPAVYEQAHYFFGDYGMVKKQSGWGFLHKSGKEVSNFTYSKVGVFSEGRALVERDYLVGYVNEEGEEVIPLIYKREFKPFQNGAAILVKDVPNNRGGLYGMIDTNGKTLVPFRMHKIDPFKDGMARIMLRTPQGNKELYGFVDSAGNQTIPIKYEVAYEFENGQTYVKETRSSEGIFLDRSGRQVEAAPEKRRTIYEAGQDLGNGYVLVISKGQAGYMNHKKQRFYENE